MDQTHGAAESTSTDTPRERPTRTVPSSIESATPKRPCQKYATKSSKAMAKQKRHVKKKAPVDDSSSSSDDSSAEAGTSTSAGDESSESSGDSSSDSSFDRAAKKKSKAKKAKAKLLAKQVKKDRKARRRAAAAIAELDVDDSESDGTGASDSDTPIPIKSKPIKKKMSKKVSRKADITDNNSDVVEVREDPSSTRLRALKSSLRHLDFNNGNIENQPRWNPLPEPTFAGRESRGSAYMRNYVPEEVVVTRRPKAKKPKKIKRASKVAYKRVDQLWDQSIHNFKLTATVKNPGEAIWDQYIFTVRRRFDWEHKYLATIVDIKSKPLKECLQHVMSGVKGVSLVEDTPHLDPNMLFLYLEEMRTFVATLQQDADGRKRKERKVLRTKAKHLQVMVKYLDKDYAETKKTLYPLLENNMITFDLLWALYKPNAIAFCATYGDLDEPRAFKIDFATKETHFMRGSWYTVEGKYLEYDGKAFGMGSMHAEVPAFQGARKITTLDCYPLQYHKDADALKAKLIQRGKSFVSLQGMNYRYHKGMAYTKRRKQVLKIYVDGRIMVDPAIHRRINPNYPVSNVKQQNDQDVIEIDDSSDDHDDDCGCGESSSSDDGADNQCTPSEDTLQEKKRFKVIKMPNGQTLIVEVDSKEDLATQTDKPLAATNQDARQFSEEELLIASPVVLGFAFNEKLWLEFTVSGISEVVFNDQAFESLVLPDNQKSIVKALVSSHAFHAHQTIDDIISGKGRGLVAVLHGPPGTGKTLTAEGIADLLKCPLYMVSAGDLGTDPTKLEKELQNILDIAHSWGAILLLDEADVFLEQRSIHDIHRNALVSIFLRLLEYFQGILFLTTNRVETFDSAFVSRIHLSLRFQNLTTKAKQTVWKLFVDRVKNQEGMELATISESDYSDLARRDVNGRQIKNLVRAAQALAVFEKVPLSMAHIKRVIDVAESFDMDLKGGTGYADAMRSYT